MISIFIKNIRDLNRYMNLLTFNFALLKDKVNLYDLALLSIFQLFENEVYSDIKNNKELLIERYRDKEIVKDFSKMIKDYNEDIMNILFTLFPNSRFFEDELFYRTYEEYGHPFDYDSAEGEKNKQIYIEKYFDVYFSASLSQ